jgi:tol-pal system protein YbgF
MRMTNRSLRPFAALVVALLLASPAQAANKEHEQLMADLRMLQEQSQLLQNMLGTLAEAVKAVNTRLDQQAEADRRTFADEKLLIDTLTKDLSVVREKVDDNNVRIGSLAQEVDALRQLVQQALARTPAVVAVDPGAGGPGAPPPDQTAGAAPAALPPPLPASGSGSGASPTKAYEQAFADYAAGLWDLAIDGFEAFIKDFPRATQADDAQFYIGRSYLQDGKYDKAVEGFDKVIRLYPASPDVPNSYYLKGVALRSLKQPDRARETWETVIKNYPDSPAASLATQALAGLGKP